MLKSIIESPDEVFIDVFNVLYYIKRVGDLYVDVIVYRGVVKTAYILSAKSCRRMREKRVQRLY